MSIYSCCFHKKKIISSTVIYLSIDKVIDCFFIFTNVLCHVWQIKTIGGSTKIFRLITNRAYKMALSLKIHVVFTVCKNSKRLLRYLIFRLGAPCLFYYSVQLKTLLLRNFRNSRFCELVLGFLS